MQVSVALDNGRRVSDGYRQAIVQSIRRLRLGRAGVAAAVISVIALLTATNTIVGVQKPSWSWAAHVPNPWGHLATPSSAIPEARVFVYELPDALEAAVLADRRGDWEQYNSDIWIRETMRTSSRRVTDPAEADLFFIPALPTRYLHSRFRDIGFEPAGRESAEYVRQVIQHVSTAWPYWNRTNGRDHFMTLAHDRGRCLHFPPIGKAVVNDMFVLQHHGDLCHHLGVKDHFEMSCYEPDRDILLPSFVNASAIAPAGRLRPIKVLYRFSQHDNKPEYHGVKVRNRLFDLYEVDPPPGADWRFRTVDETLEDMAQSVFCIMPPGTVAHTSRYWRGIQRGCVPVSFLRAYDLAFQDTIDYSLFSVNIQPDHLADLTPTIKALLSDPGKLSSMQEHLALAQSALSWDRSERMSGIEGLLWAALDKRAVAISSKLQYRSSDPA